MKTVTIQIGNTDDKLAQSRWASYVACIGECVHCHSAETHFYACSHGAERWQNACWVVTGTDRQLGRLKERITVYRQNFDQDSVAWTEGETQFV